MKERWCCYPGWTDEKRILSVDGDMKKRRDERLYRDFYPQIKSRFVARVAGEHDAEDLAQQVFAELVGGEATDNPKAYIQAIARNILAKHWRKKVKERVALPRRSTQPWRKSRTQEHNMAKDLRTFFAAWPPKTRNC